MVNYFSKGDLIMKENIITTFATNVAPSLLRKIADGARVISSSPRKVAPHVYSITTLVVENVPKKKDLAEDIAAMRDSGASMKMISDLTGVSISYAYKLLKR